MTEQGNAGAVSAPAGGSFRHSFDSTAADRAELFPEDLAPINLDAQTMVTTVITYLPRLNMLREEIASALPSFDMKKFDSLRAYAEALAHAQTAFLAASAPEDALPQLAARATELRDQLLADATALGRRGLVDKKRLADLKGGNGYLNAGSDLGVLVHMIRERWSDIKSKSAVQEDELDEAQHLYEQVTNAYAGRAQLSASAQAAADDRSRAFTVLLRAYDQARRAAAYLRWAQEDAHTFAPSLYAGRGGRRRNSSSDLVTDQPAPAPGPTDVDGLDGAPASPVAPGMPGGSPFVS